MGIEFDMIFSYTRKEAIEDGVLIEVLTYENRLNLFKYQTVVTSAVYGILDQNNLEEEFDSLFRTIAKVIIESGKESDRVDFTFKDKRMYALCHPGDDGVVPVITIMMIYED